MRIGAISGCSLLWVGLAITLGCGGGPAVSPAKIDAAESKRQTRAFVEALKPRHAGPPSIAIVARNEGTETTDFLLTHAVLQRSGVAEVHAVAPRRGRVQLYPVLAVDVPEDFAAFDAAHPSGADYVIVPALDDADDPAITRWLQEQSRRGARIVSVCAGALILGRAGLLDGRRFTTHWYFRDTVLERHPTAIYVPHQRYVVDRDVATTTGITASVPAMLALVEAIAGPDKARALADELGVKSWTPAHDSSRFGLNASRRWTYILTKLAFWRHERRAVDVRDGTDDIALAVATDAWSRTGYVDVVASAPSSSVQLRSGLRLAAEQVPKTMPRVQLAASVAPVRQLDRTLCEVAARFGDATRENIAMELEFAIPTAACARPN